MRSLPVHLFLVLVIFTGLVGACFLNSCPYRRYGRTIRCSTCGIENEGVCVGEGKCCSSEECFVANECSYNTICPELFCKIGHHPGYCMKKGYCCTQGGCQTSAMC